MGKLYMLDTNIASFAIKGHPNVKDNLLNVPMASVCISSITAAELLRGVAKKPEAKKLPIIVNEFLLRVETLPFDIDAAKKYAEFRTLCERNGKSLTAFDMLIASHSVTVNATLVSNDKAFLNTKLLNLIDWTV